LEDQYEGGDEEGGYKGADEGLDDQDVQLFEQAVKHGAFCYLCFDGLAPIWLRPLTL